MLSKEIDHTVVGHNFFAYLFSKVLIENNQSVLLLDDERFNFGDFFCETLTSLDIELLKILGEKHQLKSFKNIENYLKPKEHFFFLQRKRIYLGSSPFENYLELKRKLPNLFTSDITEEFSQDVFNYIKANVEAVFNDKKWRSERPFSLDPSNPVIKVFNEFDKLFLEQKIDYQLQNELFTLVLMTRGFYQGILSSNGSTYELLHAFLCLLSPLHSLNHEELKKDLKEEFTQSGGEFKKLNFNELKFESSSLQSFKLETFEGHIKSKKMSFIGGATRDLPLKINYSGRKFSCIKARVEFLNTNQFNVAQVLKNHHILFSSSHKIGTDRPFWFGDFVANHLEVTFIVSEKSGTKVEFYQHALQELLNADFKYIYPEFEGQIVIKEMEFSHDHLLEERVFQRKKSFHHYIPKQASALVSKLQPTRFRKLKNVYYFGPFQEELLGTYSSILKLVQIAPRMKG